MFPVDINGQVKEVNVLSKIEITDNQRVAIIYKDFKYVPAGIVDEKMINMLNDKNLDIKLDKINYVQIKDTKGLEFEKCYVISKDMTSQELYVACSRALKELIVVE